MSRGHHLGKINDHRLARFALDEDIEFIEITVDEAIIRKPQN
jgi:hypothetical protein